MFSSTNRPDEAATEVEETSTGKTIVIGLGNPILTDDGVGVRVARSVKDSLDKARRADISVAEASVGGLRLMEMMIGYDHAILIDALTPQENSSPGRFCRMTEDDLRTASVIQHSASAHDTTLITALDMGRQMGLVLPESITVFGIEVETIYEFGMRPTEAVRRAIPRVTAAVLGELNVKEMTL